jgi:hypothetical protein
MGQWRELGVGIWGFQVGNLFDSFGIGLWSTVLGIGTLQISIIT